MDISDKKLFISLLQVWTSGSGQQDPLKYLVMQS